MTGAPLIDTHVWIWWMHRDARLGTATLDALDRLPPDRRPWLSAISLWEVAMLAELGRIVLPAPLPDWLEEGTHPRTVRLAPITAAVAAEVAALPLRFHRDPADRIIVATCRALDLPILSLDRAITRSGLVPRWKRE